MKKKIAPKKKHNAVGHHLKHYFISVISVWILASLVLLFIPATPKHVCANSISCIKNLNVDVENGKPGIFMGQVVIPPIVNLAMNAKKSTVLGEYVPVGEKKIYVDLTNQHLYAFEGTTLKFSFPISSGKWRDTPDGVYHIWIKIPVGTMTGGEGADYYNLPNIQYIMYFANDEYPASDGFSLHQAYWHDNFGHPMSHGCVNMRLEDVHQLYDWADPHPTDPSINEDTTTVSATNANPGTEVIIYGTTPD